MHKVLTRFTQIILIFALSAFSVAQEYADVEIPTPIRVIVSYNAGGSTDAAARHILPYFERAIQELTGRNITTVVVNLPGAGGEIGWAALANAEADGAVIGFLNLPAVPLISAARDTAFDPPSERFEALGVNITDPNVIMLGNHTRWETLEEAIEYARTNPGEVVVGADGPLSDDHLAVYALEQATGATFAFIPYAGGGPANRAFLSREVDINMGNVFDYISSEDNVREAAVFDQERNDLIPDVPTVEELLSLEGLELGSVRGFAAPAGLPEDIAQVYQEALRMAFENDEQIAGGLERGLTLMGQPRVGEQFQEILVSQTNLVDELIVFFIEAGYIEAD
jgi:tripartite-type tricarboxylate transporter receptor subunit TctC